MSEFKRKYVLGTPVDLVNTQDCLDYIDQLVLGESAGGYVLAVNPTKVMSIQNDLGLIRIFEKAQLLLPDGIGIVMAIRILYGKRIERVTGADLMEQICRRAPERGYRIFIYGSTERVNEAAVKRLKEKYMGIKVVGRSNGYVPQQKMGELIDRINGSKAQILFVGLGSPRQEKWIAEHIDELDLKVCQGVGGALDVIAGSIKRAPDFLQRMGLEWLFRLIREPKRALRQIVLPVFAIKVISRKLRGRLS